MRKFTIEEIEQFLGSSCSFKEVVSFIQEVANCEYSVESLRSDITETLAQLKEV